MGGRRFGEPLQVVAAFQQADETVAAKENFNKSEAFNKFRDYVFKFGKDRPLFVYNNAFHNFWKSLYLP